MSGLEEGDIDAIARAVRILTEAGYTVEKSGNGKRSDLGVSFRLDITAPTRSPMFAPQSRGVRDAAIAADEYGMDGEPVPDVEAGPNFGGIQR